MDISSQLIEGQEIVTRRSSLKSSFQTMKIKSSDLFSYIDQGWEKARDYKNPSYVLVKKDLSDDILFSNKIWVLLSSMGFVSMNRDSDFSINFDEKHPEASRHFDVVATDEETVLLVECKYSSFMVESNFQNELRVFQNQIGGLRAQLQKEFGKKKVKFIWATQNYILRQLDLETFSKLNIAYFDDSAIQYFSDLVKHLGTASKYQLLGNLFAKQEISNMDNRIPAIQGRMGGYVYYSFSIEPEKLLKIGYVLHRSEANANMMPTYQRLIKKKRLTEVRSFIDNGGYFPNSIIISIDSDGKGLQFQPAGPKVDGSISRIGTLFIPKRYHSAYIIDGQHRLYGYSDSQYASTNSIPVVAFVDLDRNEQIKLFMDINENQKAVPKSLRVTLNADMLWDSEDKTEQRQALRSKIAQMLGEQSTSPLRDRIIVGEGDPTPKKCITVEAIQTALKKTSFFATYGKNNILVSDGTFETGNNEEDCNIFYPFLEGIFLYIQKQCPDEWNKSESELGMITMNRGIQAIIRVLDDIVSLLSQRGMIFPKTQTANDMISLISYYMQPLLEYLCNMSYEERKELKSYFGGGADTRFYRAYQKAVADKRLDYNPEGLSEYWENQSKTYNEDTKEMVKTIEEKLKDIVRSNLEIAYDDKWLEKGLPLNVFKSLRSQSDNDAYNKAQEGIEEDAAEPWDYVTMTDCKEIVLNGKNWSTIFESILVRDEEKDLPGDKSVKTDWILRISKIKNKLAQNSYSVSSDEYQFVSQVCAWITNILVL